MAGAAGTTGSNDTRLVVIAPSFTAPSETFIRAHLDALAPGRTGTISWKGGAAADLTGGCGTHLALEVPKRQFPTFLSRRFSDTDKARARHFLQELGRPPVLVEYGPTALRVFDILQAARCPFVVHFHGSDVTKRLRNPLLRGQYRAIFTAARAIVAPSRFLLDRLVAAGCPAEKAHVIPCGVDPGQFPAPRPDPNRLIAVGRLVDKKAPLTTIRAFARIAGRHPDAHLDIIGNGALIEPALALTAELAMGDRITLHGAQPHERVREMLSRASLFLQHSVTAKSGDTEGMPVSILEAMSLGLGIVSTLHSGIPEAIENGREGLLVPEHDEAGMADAIDRLLQHPDEARRLGAAARRRFDAEFTREITSAKLQALLFRSSER